MDQPRVSIVLLNWNSYEDTSKCLNSLSSIDYTNFQVYLIDNGSTDESVEMLREEWSGESWIKFIINKENLGFSAGCNVGIRRCLEDGTDYVLLLNNDIVVKKDFLQPLVTCVENNECVRIAGGIIKKQSTGEVWYGGGRLDKIRIKSPHHQQVRKELPYETEFITGALMLIDKSFLLEFGLLNDDYFFGMEDKELSFKARNHGVKMMIAPKSIVYHKIGGTSNAGSPFQNYNSFRNKLKFINKFDHTPTLINYIYLFLITSLRIFRWTFLGKRDQIKAMLLGVIDHYKKYPVDKRSKEMLNHRTNSEED